ncbi:tyrosine-type recombinase/integrase [Chloroflexota bacterium]
MKKEAVDSILFESLVSTTSLESLAKGYILNCKTEGKSPNIISSYEMTLRNFIWYCKQNQFPEVQKLTAVHVRHFLWYLASESHRWNSTSAAAKKQVSSATVSDYFRALRTFFNWLEREDLIIENPFKTLKNTKVDNKVIQALSPAEIDRLFKVCSGKSALEARNQAILSVFLDTGLRISELVNLTLYDVNFDDGSLLVRKGKGGKQRVVRIGNKVHCEGRDEILPLACGFIEMIDTQ